MSVLTVIGGDGVDTEVLEVIGEVLEPVFKLESIGYGRFVESEERYVWGREQYDSAGLLRDLIRELPRGRGRVLGVTGLDLCTPILTFVFGQAQLSGPAAIVSLARLRQEFYGFEPDPGLFLARLCKESTHEVGHTFGLVHCQDRECAMSLSTSIAEVDRKNIGLCRRCRETVRRLRGGSDGRSDAVGGSHE